MPPSKMSHSGFLKDYSGFEPGPKGGADLRYIREGVDFNAYDKIMLDRAVFYFSNDKKKKRVLPDELLELSEVFHKSMTEALAGAYPVVDKPGPGVLRMRIAITDVAPSNPVLNTMASLLFIPLVLSSIKKAITGTHTYVGQASIETELLDSQTNERVAAAIDKKAGARHKVLEGMHRWGHAKDAFEFWAKRLRFWLDEVRGSQVTNP
ncbi:MAG: DUF3313 domain-containing protein [Planctomycetes bacterium]|nr:DUF3313 domain-containing protein [Planctomycetota bacterium]